MFSGGEGGIRTHGTVTRTTVFETAPANGAPLEDCKIKVQITLAACPRNQPQTNSSQFPSGTFLNKSSPRNHRKLTSRNAGFGEFFYTVGLVPQMEHGVNTLAVAAQLNAVD